MEAHPEKISVYEAVRSAQPGFVPHVMHKPSVVKLSHIVEAAVEMNEEPRGVLFGLFQKERFFAQSKSSWLRLASNVEFAAVFARGFDRETGPIVRLSTGDALADDEWAVIYDTEAGGVGMVAREVKGSASVPDELRRFETLRLTEQRALRAASQAIRALAVEIQPEIEERLPSWFASASAHRSLG